MKFTLDQVYQLTAGSFRPADMGGKESPLDYITRKLNAVPTRLAAGHVELWANGPIVNVGDTEEWTHVAVDGDGSIWAYDREPTYNRKLREWASSALDERCCKSIGSIYSRGVTRGDPSIPHPVDCLVETEHHCDCDYCQMNSTNC